MMYRICIVFVTGYAPLNRMDGVVYPGQVVNGSSTKVDCRV